MDGLWFLYSLFFGQHIRWHLWRWLRQHDFASSCAVCRCSNNTFMTQACSGNQTYIGLQANDNRRGDAVCQRALLMSPPPLADIVASLQNLRRWSIYLQCMQQHRWRRGLARHYLHK